MVILETTGSSVVATLKESMLNPLPENRPAIRDSTPGSLSTRIDNKYLLVSIGVSFTVCIIFYTRSISVMAPPAGTMG